jgi:hypothetical protein
MRRQTKRQPTPTTPGCYPVSPCRECGQPAKFAYHVETDGGRRIDARTPLGGIQANGPFCSVGCFREYNS